MMADLGFSGKTEHNRITSQNENEQNWKNSKHLAPCLTTELVVRVLVIVWRSETKKLETVGLLEQSSQYKYYTSGSKNRSENGAVTRIYERN